MSKISKTERQLARGEQHERAFRTADSLKGMGLNTKPAKTGLSPGKRAAQKRERERRREAQAKRGKTIVRR